MVLVYVAVCLSGPDPDRRFGDRILKGSREPFFLGYEFSKSCIFMMDCVGYVAVCLSGPDPDRRFGDKVLKGFWELHTYREVFSESC